MNNTAEICRKYAELLCAIREFEKAVTMVFEMAPPEAREYLDTIKKVMEIDKHVTDVNLVLMRASVAPNPATALGAVTKQYVDEGYSR